jgi:hypothetical protein
MTILNDTFKALLEEASFTKEMLGSGATQIRNANYASKGIYFQAFTSLSTGLERIGKLCLMLDHYIDNGGNFPDFKYMKNQIGHKLMLLYEKSRTLIQRRAITLPHLQDLSDPVYQAILRVLHDFAEGDRYSNINLLVGSLQTGDPIAAWFNLVDVPLFNTRISKRRKQTIAKNASFIKAIMGNNTMVLHTSEAGTEITDIEDASIRTGVYEAVAPFRQLYVLQIIRYWVELLSSLEIMAQRLGNEDVPFFSELLAAFYNDDSYFRTRKTWEGI